MTLIEQFDYLRHQDPKKRGDAVVTIVQLLGTHAKTEAVGSLPAIKQQYGDDVEYTIKRLLKGLSSNRESARLGFSAALSEGLRLVNIDTGFLIGEIDRLNKPGPGASKQEVRDAHFAKVFGLQALFTAGYFGSDRIPTADLVVVVRSLLSLGREKNWFTEACYRLVAEMARADALLAEAIRPDLGDDYSIDSIGLAIACDAACGPRRPLFPRGDLQKLARVMRAAPPAQGEDKGHEGGKSKLHWTWQLLIPTLAAQSGDDEITLPAFWRVCVEDGLYAANSSVEKKFWGLQVFSLSVVVAPAGMLAELVTPNCVRCLTNQLAQGDRLLHKAAKHCATVMLEVATSDPAKAWDLAHGLLKSNIYFDRMSKTKTCEQLAAVVTAGRQVELVRMLEAAFLTSPDDAESKRTYVADLMVSQAKSLSFAQSTEAVERLVRFFIYNGFVVARKPKYEVYAAEPALVEKTREALRTRLTAVFGNLLQHGNGGGASAALQAVTALREYREAPKKFALAATLDDALSTLLASSERHLVKLVKAQGGKHTALATLYAIGIVNLHAADPEAAQLLEDLEECYRAVGRQDKTAAGTEQGEVAGLVDIMLGFVSKDSAVVRKLVTMVFRDIAPSLDPSALQLLLNVLDGAADGGDLFDEDEEMADDDEEEEADGEEDDDEDDDSDDDHDDDNDEGDDEEAVDDDERNAALDAALMQALGPKSLKRKRDADDDEGKDDSNSDDASDDEEDDDDEDEELLDDDAMLALDETLANIFRQRGTASTAGAGEGRPGRSGDAKTKRRQEREDKARRRDGTTKFKLKVIDLLDVCLFDTSRQPPAPAEASGTAGKNGPKGKDKDDAKDGASLRNIALVAQSLPTLCRLTRSSAGVSTGAASSTAAAAGTKEKGQELGDNASHAALVNKAVNLVRKCCRPSLLSAALLSPEADARDKEVVRVNLVDVHEALLKGAAQSSCSIASGWLARLLLAYSANDDAASAGDGAGNCPGGIDGEGRDAALAAINALYANTQLAYIRTLAAGGRGANLLGKNARQFFADWLVLAPGLLAGK